jgi:hypothetical protein
VIEVAQLLPVWLPVLHIYCVAVAAGVAICVGQLRFRDPSSAGLPSAEASLSFATRCHWPRQGLSLVTTGRE